MSVKLALGALLVVALVCGAPSGALAAPPSNDDFADAREVQLPEHVTGTIVDATLETGEPDPSGDGSIRSVWYRYTPATEQRVKLDTCASTFFASAAVYTGSSVDHLIEVPALAVGCDSGVRSYFTAAAGATYHIAVTGYLGDDGAISLALSAPQPPSNDDFADAEAVDLPDQVTGTITDATLEAGEPDASEEGRSTSIWYRYTAATAGPVKLDSCASPSYARADVFTGADVSHLTVVARGEDGCDGGGRTYFTAAAGTTYHIMIAGWVGQEGAIAFSVSVPQPPANDDFAAARPVGMPESLTGTNVDATFEPGEPDPFGDRRGNTVWYRLTMGTTQAVGIDTCGSDIDTVLGVYFGAGIGNISEVGLDDDSCELGSIVDFVSSPGSTYWIMVRGYGGEMGDFRLLVGGAHGPIQQPPPGPSPACPPAGSPVGAVGYAGTHSAGGSVCLAVLPTFAGVSSFHVFDAPGDVCRFGFAIDRFSPAMPITNRAFAIVRDAIAGSFPSDRGAQGTFQLTRFNSAGDQCNSPRLSWTAATSATPPWAVLAPPVAPPVAPPIDRTAPALRLRGPTVQRPLETNRVSVVARCPTEQCSARATASIAGVKLATRDIAIRRGFSRRLSLVLTTRARKALRRSLRARRRVTARVLVVARDAAGNRASARRTITLRR